MPARSATRPYYLRVTSPPKHLFETISTDTNKAYTRESNRVQTPARLQGMRLPLVRRWLFVLFVLETALSLIHI
eukprot:5786782-Pleurochrysis_carterae.AAC.2